MKNLLNDAWRHNGKSLDMHDTNHGIIYMAVLACSIFALACLFTGCQKQVLDKTQNEVQETAAIKSQADVLNFYEGLSSQTRWELQQARAATAKYRNIDNAVKDGYQDIEVDVEHMGHHFMNTSLVDSVFDIRHPEILVYNRNGKGEQELVAVEYAVPLGYPVPEGFTGSDDVWNGTSGFPLWLLHAWVWKYNPDGVFNWTNPLVDLH